MRNLAGRRFSATSRYHDSAPRIAESSQTLSLSKSLMNRPSLIVSIPWRRPRPRPWIFQPAEPSLFAEHARLPHDRGGTGGILVAIRLPAHIFQKPAHGVELRAETRPVSGFQQIGRAHV